jgi:hypothetical protein
VKSVPLPPKSGREVTSGSSANDIAPGKLNQSASVDD